ncbi:MAG: hypothetical protein J7453_06030 [Thermomicrobium sp.]|nr:hypothetical protein [Thermomicrobium sp.]
MALDTGLPAGLLLASLLGSMLGLGWHAVFGRRIWQLPLYWLGGVLGFGIGSVASQLFGMVLYRLGTVPLVEGGLGALFVLGILWLVTTPAEAARSRRARQRVRRNGDRSSGEG